MTQQPHRARKRFGQNFLHDSGVIQRIVNAIHPAPSQRLVEVGPGLGALTSQLLPSVGHMDVVELDRDVIPHLQQACNGLGELQIHLTDALKFDFCSLIVEGEKLRVVGNLPYNISTPLLFHFTEQLHCIQDMHFMLQKEVVDRMVAEPGTKDYGRLGIMLQYYCRIDRLFIVRPGAFTPAPKVDSAVVRLVPHASPPVNVTNPATLSKVVAQAFSQRRKTLRNTLKGLLTGDQISNLGIDPSRRPETLTLEEYALLSNAVDRDN